MIVSRLDGRKLCEIGISEPVILVGKDFPGNPVNHKSFIADRFLQVIPAIVKEVSFFVGVISNRTPEGVFP